MKTTKQFITFLLKEAYPYYVSEDYVKGSFKDRRLVAAMQSLSFVNLADVWRFLECDPACPKTLYYKFLQIFKSAAERTEDKTPVASLLELYSGKGSRQAAALQMKRRYDDLSHEDRRLVLLAFLNGAKKERDWAARHLRDEWIEAFGPVVKDAWKKHHDRALAFVILRHIPDAFVLDQQEELAEAAGYMYVCARLGSLKWFKVDTSRLSVPQWFYAMAKSGAKVSKNDLKCRLEEYLASRAFDPGDVNLLLWAMGRLGMTDELMALPDYWPVCQQQSFVPDDYPEAPETGPRMFDLEVE